MAHEAPISAHHDGGPFPVSDVFFHSVSLSDLTLRVNDLEAVGTFYRDVLGFSVVDKGEGRLAMSADGAAPALLILEHAPKAPERRIGWAGLFHAAWLFPDRASLGRMASRLMERRIRFGVGDHGVSEALYFEDPEGNGIELYADRPVDHWPVPRTNGDVHMYTAAVDLDSLAREGLQASGPLLPPTMRLGHVHLSVSNLEAAGRFYAGALGFPVRQRDLHGALFFGRDGYHHHLAANTWQCRRPVEEGVRGLVRFTIRFAAADEREKVVAAVKASGGAFQPGADAVRVRDPEGIEIELR